jgi:tetratricopeptide (TPR) repeat protein
LVPLEASRSPAAQAPAERQSDAYYQFLLGRHLAGEGDVEGAIKAFQQAAASDPSASEIPAELSSLYFRLNRPTDAIAAAEAAVKISSESFEAHRVLGMIYAARLEGPGRNEASAGDLAQAVTHFEKALTIPGYGGRAAVQLALARLYLRDKAYDQAIAALTRLISQESEELEALPLLAQAYSATGRTKEAAGVLEQLVDYAPQFYPTLGDLYAREHQWKEAAQAYREAAGVYTRNSEMKRRLAWALKNSGDVAGSLSVLKEAVDSYPDDPAAYAALAEGYSDQAQYGQALGVLDQAVTKFPKNTTVIFQRGATLERQSRHAEAEQAFLDVIAKDPKHAAALNYLGYMLAERGERLTESVGYIKRALEVDPDNGAYLDSLGWAYFKLNQLELAESNLRRAADQMKEDSVVQDHFGDVLFRLGRNTEAVQAWERALAGDRQSINPAEIEKKLQKARQR